MMPLATPWTLPKSREIQPIIPSPDPVQFKSLQIQLKVLRLAPLLCLPWNVSNSSLITDLLPAMRATRVKVFIRAQPLNWTTLLVAKAYSATIKRKLV